MKTFIIFFLFMLASYLPAYTQDECNFTAGQMQNSNSTDFCTSIDPDPLTESVPATGSGSLSYQWQISRDRDSFTDIPGATGTTYDPPVILESKHYRRMTTHTLNGVSCTKQSDLISFWAMGGTVGFYHYSGAPVITICNGNDVAFIQTSERLEWPPT